MSALKDKILFGVIIALFVLGVIAGVALYFKTKKVETLQETVITQEISIKGLTDTLETKGKSDDVTDKTSVDIQQGAQDVRTDSESIEVEVQAQVHAIDNEYKAKEPTPTNTQARSQAVSKARIEGLWKNYCAAQTAASACIK